MGERQSDPAVLVEGHVVVGATIFGHSLQDGIDHLEHAIELFDPAQQGAGRFRAGASPGVIARNAAALLLTSAGWPERGSARAVEAVELARQLRHPFSLAYSLYHVGYLDLIRGRFAATRQRAAALTEVARENDYSVWLALAAVLDGVASCGLNDVEWGLAQAARGTELYQGLTTPPVFWAPLQAIRALGYHLAGQPAQAVELIEGSLQLLEGTTVYPEFRVLHGDILNTTGGRHAAEPPYRAALEISQAVGARLTEVAARCRLLRMEDAASRQPADVEALRSLYATFTEGFDEPELIDARSLLEPA